MKILNTIMITDRHTAMNILYNKFIQLRNMDKRKNRIDLNVIKISRSFCAKQNRSNVKSFRDINCLAFA